MPLLRVVGMLRTYRRRSTSVVRGVCLETGSSRAWAVATLFVKLAVPLAGYSIG